MRGGWNVGATMTGRARTAVACLKLMRVHRPVGTLLLLWPTLAALWMAAGGSPPLDLLLIFVVGTFLARSAGCVANDIADRDFDGHVRRTRERPLPAGEISSMGAVVLLVTLAVLCMAVVLMLNPLARWLAVAGAAIALAYPFCKRFTQLPQAVLGIAFSWGIPMAFAAVTGSVPFAAWLFFVASCVWIVAYDTIYALIDRDDDLAIGVKSAAILFGAKVRPVLGVLQATTVALFVWLGVHLGFAHAYFAACAVAVVLFIRQQAQIRTGERDACLRAFSSNAWVGFALFAGTAAEYALADAT